MTDPVDTSCKWVKQDSCVRTQFYSNVKFESCDILCVGGSNVCFLTLCACVLVRVPACVFTPAALERYRECQEAAGAWRA